MKNNRRMLISMVWVLLGVGLIVAGRITEMDDFWSGDRIYFCGDPAAFSLE